MARAGWMVGADGGASAPPAAPDAGSGSVGCSAGGTSAGASGPGSGSVQNVTPSATVADVVLTSAPSAVYSHNSAGPSAISSGCAAGRVFRCAPCQGLPAWGFSAS